MENEELKKPEKDPDKTDKILGKAADTYNWWNRLATINEDDSLLVGFSKIVIRIIGILILLAISPFVILGLIVGMTAAF